MIELETKEINGIVVIKPLGKRIDASESTSFKGQVIDLIARGKYQFVLDLAQIDFIDSSGLGSMISILKSIAGKGNFVLCHVKSPVMSLLKLTRMDRVFQISDSEEGALQLFQNQANFKA